MAADELMFYVIATIIVSQAFMKLLSACGKSLHWRKMSLRSSIVESLVSASGKFIESTSASGERFTLSE